VKDISDIHITGIDETRPPRIRKEPYIDLFFKLSHQAPADWCSDFNGMMANHPRNPSIKKEEGLYIETWVRAPGDINELFNLLKETVQECSVVYIQRIEDSIRQSSEQGSSSGNESEEQKRLNQIISELDFGDNH
jgi:hypothetical protein